MFRRIPLLCVACLAILAAGCGGGEDDGPPPLTNDVFITKADKVCDAGLKELQDKVRAAFGNQAPTEDEVLAFTTSDQVPLLTAQIADLRALTPPEGDEETVNAIWDSMEEAVNTMQDDPAEVLSDPSPMADALELARSYGFRTCGKIDEAPPAS